MPPPPALRTRVNRGKQLISNVLVADEENVEAGEVDIQKQVEHRRFGMTLNSKSIDSIHKIPIPEERSSPSKSPSKLSHHAVSYSSLIKWF